MCPLLSDKGCKLGLNKPFKCAIWPLYIVKINHKTALAVSDVCPNVYGLSNKEILHGINNILPDIQTMARNYPELIEQYRDNYRFVTYLDS